LSCDYGVQAISCVARPWDGTRLDWIGCQDDRIGWDRRRMDDSML